MKIDFFATAGLALIFLLTGATVIGGPLGAFALLGWLLR
jgi:hypothetical protein